MDADQAPINVVTLSERHLHSLISDTVEATIRRLRSEEQFENELLTARAAAKFVRRRIQDVVEALKTGALPGSKRGRAWSICRSDLIRWDQANSRRGDGGKHQEPE